MDTGKSSRFSKVAPRGKVLAAKKGDLNSVSGAHMVEGENSQKRSSDLHIMMGLHTHTPHINIIKN